MLRFLTYPSLKPNMSIPSASARGASSGSVQPLSFEQQAAAASLLSVITLRDPIDRILSLYWYEHVGWFDGIQKKPEKCATLKDWIAYWQDGSVSKTKFQASNPYNVYVEISNYYVKSLVGWKGPSSGPSSGGGSDVVINDSLVDKQRSRSWLGKKSSSSSSSGGNGSGTGGDDITQEHLQLAKNVLNSFDVVLLTGECGTASFTIYKFQYMEPSLLRLGLP